MNENILHELSQPFPVDQIEWQVDRLSQDQTKALAVPSVTLRAYLNRLDQVCGLAWSVTYTPWGERLVCHLTIHGVTRSSTGELDSQPARPERASALAETQAFKRACVLFGLGRDLETLPSAWVDYNPATQQFTAAAQTHLASLLGQPSPPTPLASQPTQAPPLDKQTLHQEETPAQAEAEPPPAINAETVLATLRTVFNEAGHDLYGEQWVQVSKHNIERITGGQGQSANDLSEEQLQKLIDGMRQLKRKRQGKKATEEATSSA
ncbi:MAG: hypothetical protein NT075_22400 [Chloroflexi bacterium]|nr:hypothetical protein [Chloroflexota bacterium]